jgi:ankyrin repeat protein
MRIQGQAYPEFAPVLHALFTALSAPQGNQILQGGSQNPIESGMLHALSCIQARPNFREIVSTTNEYSQTLAHLVILYDYPSLLRHLVDWHIDLAISDVNGLTALHCAYMKGDLDSVRILRRGGAPEAAKDKLGRIPSDLQPEGFGRGFDIDAEAHPPGINNDEQVELRGQFRALDLDEDKDSGYHQPDSKDDAPDDKEPASMAIDSFADGDEGGSGSGGVQIAPGPKDPVIERGLRILPSPPPGTSFDVSRSLREVASKPLDILTWGISPACDSGDGGGSDIMTFK